MPRPSTEFNRPTFCPNRSGFEQIIRWVGLVIPLCCLIFDGIFTQTFADDIGADHNGNGLAFEVKCICDVGEQPRPARVYVMLDRDRSAAEPRLGPDWFRPQPFFAMEIKDWRPNAVVRIDGRAIGFPASLDELEPGGYRMQAVVRLNRDSHRIGDGEGNVYGPIVRSQLDPRQGRTVLLTADTIVPPRKFPETERIRSIEIPSPMLSSFHDRPIKHRAAVILPEDLGQSERHAKRPTLYIIPGFGGDHFMASRFLSDPRMAYANDFIRVVLDPDCGTGHHVFADSATNGPRGAALVEELIPYIEKTFPAIADSRARLLNGHSSGGWSSLWLQVAYPDIFGGTWSTSPDPVDFRDFQQIDLYATGENMFHDHMGQRRPIARIGSTPALFYDRFSRMDDVIGWGGQLGSFEAVFSPVDHNGHPRKLWNRATGVIDLEVAKAWEKYDLRLVIERNWPIIGPKLKGKLHVITGGLDTFYLEGAVKLLKTSLDKLGSDAILQVIPNRDHSTVLDANLAKQLDQEMKQTVSTIWSIKSGIKPVKGN